MRRHPFDPYSFVFGLAFAGIGAVLLDTDVDVADLAGAGWLPVPAVVLGLFLLALGLDRARSSRAEAEPAAAASPDEASAPDESGPT